MRTSYGIEAVAVLAAMTLLGACGAGSATTKGDSVPAAAAGAEVGPMWKDAESVKTGCDAALARAEVLRERVRASGGAGGRDTLDLYNEMSLAVDEASGWSGLMFQVHPDEKVRGAAEECEQRLSRFGTEVSLDRGIYDALAGIDAPALPPLAQRSLKHSLRDFRRAGVDKDDATRARLKAIKEEMVEISQQFAKNVSSDTRSIRVDPSALEGLPADWIANHPAGDDGKVEVTTNYPDFFPFQTYAKDESLRKALYAQFMTRAYPINKPLLDRMLKLRHEFANLLGHPDWASYNAEDKMAGSSETIDAFIKDVTRIARPRMERDVAELLTEKRKDLPKAEAIEVWDRFYYASKVREAKFDFDARTVRPYFSYPKVKDGILALYAELFGLEFVPRPDLPVWHPTVEAYEMKVEGRSMGEFFLDAHPRADKYKHAAVFPVRTGLETGRSPIATLVTNFPNPAEGDGQALMEHGQVITFFHEFGHLVHHLLGQKTVWANLAGFNVEWDFVEAPSQILEEWGWDPAVLARFAHHTETGEPIPAALVKKMKDADEFGLGVHVMRQLFYTAFSFYLHRRDPTSIDLDAFSDEIYGKFSPYPKMEGSYVYANFGHLMGYSSMYYTYQWSLAIAKDLFTRFEGKGLLDRETALRYRRLILEPGATRDARQLVEDFLGRPQTLDAYRAWLSD